jgi:hypothetical protein
METLSVAAPAVPAKALNAHTRMLSTVTMEITFFAVDVLVMWDYSFIMKFDFCAER